MAGSLAWFISEKYTQLLFLFAFLSMCTTEITMGRIAINPANAAWRNLSVKYKKTKNPFKEIRDLLVAKWF